MRGVLFSRLVAKNSVLIPARLCFVCPDGADLICATLTSARGSTLHAFSREALSSAPTWSACRSLPLVKGRSFRLCRRKQSSLLLLATSRPTPQENQEVPIPSQLSRATRGPSISSTRNSKAPRVSVSPTLGNPPRRCGDPAAGGGDVLLVPTASRTNPPSHARAKCQQLPGAISSFLMTSGFS